MRLWLMDIMGGLLLADGGEAKLITGVDDHSRFCVIASVVTRPTGRLVCAAFAEAMRAYGVPLEVLTDNGKQFTGRFGGPKAGEVLFERVCRENGIKLRHTAPAPRPLLAGDRLPWHALRYDGFPVPAVWRPVAPRL
jgi:transposase InsO family protein